MKKANVSEFLNSLRITDRGNIRVVTKTAKKVKTASVELLGKLKTASKLTIKEAKTLRQAGIFKLAERDLYQHMETGDFWKISEDKKGLVRMFKEQNGVADKAASKKKAAGCTGDELQIETPEHAKKVLDSIDKSKEIPDSHVDEHKERIEDGEKPQEVMKDFFQDMNKEKAKHKKKKKGARDPNKPDAIQALKKFSPKAKAKQAGMVNVDSANSRIMALVGKNNDVDGKDKDNILTVISKLDPKEAFLAGMITQVTLKKPGITNLFNALSEAV